MAVQPNIVMIMTDQQRADMTGPGRHPCADFPALEQLRSESVCFEQFYTSAVPCVPSRHVFLTGRNEWTVGCDVNRKFSKPDEVTWMSVLRDQGYKTVSVGKTHEVHAGSHHVQVPVGNSFNPGEVEPGFNHYEVAESKEPEESYFDIQTANRACGLLGELAPRGPFALFVGFHAPHEPYVMPKKYLDAVKELDIPLPEVLPDEYKTKCQSFRNRVDFLNERFGPIDDEKTRTGLRGYIGMMKMIDECVGQVLNKIETLGLLDDTIIIFTSDHGDVLGEHGIFNKTATFYEGEVRIPFFIRVPGGKHRSVTGFGSNIDFVPTLFDLLDINPDLSLPGYSLKPMFGGGTSPRDHLLSSIGPAMMIRTEKHKLWLDSRHDDGELYDLEKDPKEQYNLFNDPAHSEIRGRLTERIALERIRSDLRNNKATEREWNLSLEVAVTGEPEVGYGGR